MFNYVTCKEINDAEILLLKLVQKEMFTKEQDDKLKTFNIFKDENGLMRVKTKIFYRDDSKNFCCPVVLDSLHIIVQRIIEEEHCNLSHAGIQTLLCNLREKFLIFSARCKICSIISKCIKFKRYNAKQMEVVAAPLPIERVRDAATFEIIGVDLANLLFLNNQEKIYVCLFTCAVYRAVNLEL